MVTGADLIFHYNRFYDAMQMKEGISPILSVCMAISSQDGLSMLSMAILCLSTGVLVLLSGPGSLSDFVQSSLGTLSATSLYLLMRGQGQICSFHPLVPLLCNDLLHPVLVGNSRIYQLGCGPFPLCLIPAVRFLQTKKYRYSSWQER